LDELIAQGDASFPDEPQLHRRLPEHLFTPLMDAFAKQARSAEAMSVFEKMLSLGIKPHAYSYTILMDAYRRSGDHDAVWQMWKVLRSELAHRETQRTTTNSISSDASLSHDQQPLGMPLLRAPSMISPPETRVPCHAVSILMDSLMAMNKVEQVDEIWEELTNSGFAFDAHNINHYAQFLIKAMRIEKACEIVNDRLVAGWDAQLATWRRYHSQDPLRIKAERLAVISPFYPHRRTLEMLGDAFDQMRLGEMASLRGNVDRFELATIQKRYPKLAFVVQETEEYLRMERRRAFADRRF
jgi:pentatricopeptide repeat protein